MTPDVLLSVLAAFAGFMLKTSLAFGVCWGISRLTRSPNRRFLIWLGFLYGSAIYWLLRAHALTAVGHSLGNATSALHQSVIPSMSLLGSIQIPASWTFPLAIALRIIGIAYLVTFSAMIVAYLKRVRQLHWVLRFTTAPPKEIAELFRPLAGRFHVGRSRLMVLSGIPSPATFGWIRPAILLPDLCLKQDRCEIEDILRHELHHVRRQDFLWEGLGIICRALVCFHPAAWYAVRKMQFERELACDLAVVSTSPTGRANYAECLLRFARLNAPEEAGAWGIDFAAASRHLTARIHAILRESKRAPIWSICLRAACALAIVVGFVGVAPSLVVPLSFSPTEQQVAQPSLDTSISATRAEIHVRTTQPRTKGLAKLRNSNRKDRTDETIGERAQPAALTETTAGTAISSQSTTGPQLIRRGALAPGVAKNRSGQQSVALVDPDAGQVKKSGDRDEKQAIQQSVTAAMGIYKRLSAVDRH
jgi:beta-lactamase regulating signal transducer with metallopeptidase domain